MGIIYVTDVTIHVSALMAQPLWLPWDILQICSRSLAPIMELIADGTVPRVVIQETQIWKLSPCNKVCKRNKITQQGITNLNHFVNVQ